jgi:hypothetical protein
MTSWNPVWSVSINGVSYTHLTLANMSVSSGRSDIYSQPIASYCSVDILNLDASPVSIEINDSITIQVKNSSGVFTPIYGGFVTDIDQTITSSGDVGSTQVFRITALGALSKLPKILTEGALSKDHEGDQIYTVLEPIFRNAWNEVAPTLQWSNYTPANETWANAQNIGLGEIDRPGDFEMTDRNADTTDVYSLIANLATSGLGYIYEDANGAICYADSTHRSQYLAANGFTDISAGQALAKGISTSRKLGDIRNKVTVTYKNNAQETASDTTSINTYGELAQNIVTSIENSADATSQANFYLALRSNPQTKFKSITYELTNSELDNADRDALLGVFMGLPVNITNLPANILGGQFQGFVEGWSFNVGYNRLSVTLNLSPVSFSMQYMKWNLVNVAETWNTLVPTLQWINATIVA